MLVHDAVVQEVVEQRGRRAVRVARHEDGRARDARRDLHAHELEEIVERNDALAELLIQELPPAPPRREDR